MTKLKTFTAIAALLASSSVVHAATLDWTYYAAGDLATAKTDRALIDDNFLIAFEDFESFSTVPNGGTGVSGSTATPLDTNVGQFTTDDGANNTCGGSCDTPEDESLVRSTSNFGRYDTTTGTGNWLDSNDNSQLSLSVDNLTKQFDRISFFLTDVDDVGPKTFSITVDGTAFDLTLDYPEGGAPDNGDLFLVSIGLHELASTAVVDFNIDDGDGFGIDDFRIGSSVNPIPVPASLPLLAAGLGAMGWAARRRKRAS